MLTLRFQRVGKTHDTTFRIVAVDSRFSSKSGKAKEILGWWDPRKDKFELKKERIEYWLKNGAQASDSCFNLLIKAKIIEGKKRPVVIHKKKAKEGEEAQIKAEAPKKEEVQPSEILAEPTIEIPKEKEEIKEEPKEEPKPEEKEKIKETKEVEEKIKEKKEVEKEVKEEPKVEKEIKEEKSPVKEKKEIKKEEVKKDADSK